MYADFSNNKYRVLCRTRDVKDIFKNDPLEKLQIFFKTGLNRFLKPAY